MRWGWRWVWGLWWNRGSGSSGGGSVPPSSTPSVTFDPTLTSFTSDRAAPRITSNIILTLKNATTTGLWLSATRTNVAIYNVRIDTRDANIITILFAHRPPGTLFNGTYTDRLVVNLCLDEACTKPDGSPLTIPITYTVTGTDSVTGLTGPPPDPKAPPLAEPNRKLLTHDVLNAEYIRNADRIVMTAAYPSNALYVYDVATGIEKSLPLARKPTALSISPDGSMAAVGHAGLISIVSLAQLEQLPAQQPQQLPISATVFDLVLDGKGRVYYIGDTEDPTGMHSVDIATGTDTPSSGQSLYGRSYPRFASVSSKKICEPPGSRVICPPCCSPTRGLSRSAGTAGRSSNAPSLGSLKSGAGRRCKSVRRQASSAVEGRERALNTSQAEVRKEARPFFEARSLRRDAREDVGRGEGKILCGGFGPSSS